ncbi:MAG: YebC/PmpR family DNA-binding transcriptional regulator [Bacteroidetes bacterium HGW-Bacteroidetes-21]|nr:MAG: YebC/PmpR family DNA-binding transcriptional regulator [Bacteroidetes bacterium HGW-Bacteroidetes-21]
MSGHNKWSTIKRKKGALDSKRSKIFSRIIKEIGVAVKEGGGDPDGNPRLRTAIQNAKGVNMPKENIQRAIAKASAEGSSFIEVNFEGYLHGGVAVFIECLTDNNNRTVSNIRSIFNKRGGNLGTNGSLSFIFERKGVITLQKNQIKSMDDFELEIIDAGVEDIEVSDEVLILTMPLESFGAVQKKLESMKLEAENAELRRIANDTKNVDADTARKILRIIDDFEDDDDVQNVFHNLELTDEIMNELEAG